MKTRRTQRRLRALTKYTHTHTRAHTQHLSLLLVQDSKMFSSTFQNFPIPHLSIKLYRITLYTELKLQKRFVFTKSVHTFVKLTKVVYITYHKLLHQDIKKWDKIIHFSLSLSFSLHCFKKGWYFKDDNFPHDKTGKKATKSSCLWIGIATGEEQLYTGSSWNLFVGQGVQCHYICTEIRKLDWKISLANVLALNKDIWSHRGGGHSLPPTTTVLYNHQGHNLARIKFSESPTWVLVSMKLRSEMLAFHYRMRNYKILIW